MAPTAENVSGSTVILFGDVNHDRGKNHLEVKKDRNPAIQKGDFLKHISTDDFGKVSEDGEPKDIIAVTEALPVILI